MTVSDLKNVLITGEIYRWRHISNSTALQLLSFFISMLIGISLAVVSGKLAFILFGFVIWLISMVPIRKICKKLYRIGAVRKLGEMASSGNVEAVNALIKYFTENQNGSIRHKVLKILKSVKSEACINEICNYWVNSRDKEFEKIIVNAGYIGGVISPENIHFRFDIANSPMGTRILTALKLKKGDLIKDINPEFVTILVKACDDIDIDISVQAQLALAQLTKPESKDMVCQIYIEQDNPFARNAVIQGQYIPRDKYNRTVYFFLTEQWERYESLDFDHSMLRSVFESAEPPLRSRILEKLKISGRVGYLTIITDSDDRITNLEKEEMRFMIDMLVRNKEWLRLWKLLFDLPYIRSIETLRILNQNGWTPENVDDRSVFEELNYLVTNNIFIPEEKVNELIPPAIQGASLRITGRINDVAFSPYKPFIAIGMGQGKVILYDFQKSAIVRIFDNFNHSIGRVNFTKSGTLLCAERTRSPLDECKIYLWSAGYRTMDIMGSHNGSVTAIEPFQDDMILSTGRDQMVILWDVGNIRQIEKAKMPYTWARSARISDDGRFAVLLFNGICIMSLPKMEFSSNLYWQGIACSAAFTHAGEGLIIGKMNGELISCKILNSKGELDRSVKLLDTHISQIRDIEVMPDRNIALTGSSDGELRFFELKDGKRFGKVDVPGMHLTSLHVSPDKSFMAVGNSDSSRSSMTLWDLRMLDLAVMFSNPLSKAVPNNLGAIRALLKYSSLPNALRNTLLYVDKALQYRFRYEIEIDDIITIGEGIDIEIE
jgi:WD40 repeat protein